MGFLLRGFAGAAVKPAAMLRPPSLTAVGGFLGRVRVYARVILKFG
jgi:hypothetical protein